jgi:hypothetical protein
MNILLIPTLIIALCVGAKPSVKRIVFDGRAYYSVVIKDRDYFLVELPKGYSFTYKGDMQFVRTYNLKEKDVLVFRQAGTATLIGRVDFHGHMKYKKGFNLEVFVEPQGSEKN